MARKYVKIEKYKLNSYVKSRSFTPRPTLANGIMQNTSKINTFILRNLINENYEVCFINHQSISPNSSL